MIIIIISTPIIIIITGDVDKRIICSLVGDFEAGSLLIRVCGCVRRDNSGSDEPQPAGEFLPNVLTYALD